MECGKPSWEDDRSLDGQGVLCGHVPGAFLAAPYLVPAQLAAAEAEVTGVSHPSMYFAVQGLVTAVVGAFSTGLVWPNLRNITPGGNEVFGAHLMPYIAALGCVLAFFIAAKLPKMFDSFGKDQ